MIKFKDSNIDLLEAIIYDADFHLSDLPKETESGTVIFNFRRPYWEHQERRKFLLIKQTLVKEIYSRLTFSDITIISYKWKDDTYNNPSDHHSIYGVYVDKQKLTLTFDTAYLEVTFKFKTTFQVTLTDITKPTTTNFIRIIGWKGMDYEAWKNEYDKSLVIKNENIPNGENGST